MTCRVIDTEHGRMIVCSGRQPKPKCIVCGIPADFLCDYPVGESKTCDNPVCYKHRIAQGVGIDYCPKHIDLFSKTDS